MLWKRTVATLAILATLLLGAHAADMGNGTVFSQTDGSNNSGTVPTWAEAMAPSQVNDSARALQGALKRFWDRLNPTIASTGSAPAYVLTYGTAPAALYNGERYSFEANFTNTATASTLNINSLGAKAIKFHSGGNLYDLPANTIYSGDHVEVSYDLSSDVFVLHSPMPGSGQITAYKTANETVSNGGLQNDDHLFFAVAANTTYEFEFDFFFESSSTADFIMKLTGPAAPTEVLSFYDIYEPDDVRAENIIDDFSQSTSVSYTAGSLGHVKITGILQNGANAGTVQLQWGQNVPTVTNTVVFKGGILRYSVVP